MTRSVSVKVRLEWDVYEARRAAQEQCRLAGFDRTLAHYVITAVSELGHNLVFHAQSGGTVTLRRLEEPGRTGVEVVARDRGPGIPDIEQALTDGYSSNGGLGGGLPGVRRLMDNFEIDSNPSGTRIRAVKWKLCRLRAVNGP